MNTGDTMGEESGEEKKTVVIRGVEGEIYRRLSELSKKTDKTLGELATQAFKLYLSMVELGGKIAYHTLEAIRGVGERLEKFTKMVVVRDVEELEISKRDLEEVEEPIVIIGVKRVIIGDDVSYEMLEKKIRDIVDVEEVEIPPSLPKLKVLGKCRFVKRLKVRGE